MRLERYESKGSRTVLRGGDGSNAVSLPDISFGKFDVRCGQQVLVGLDAPKVQELFTYLLLYRARSHSREALADLLWSDCTSAHSRKCLRQILWRLQATWDSHAKSVNGSLLLMESNWVQLNPKAELWIDIAEFEEAYNLVHRVPGQELKAQGVQAVWTAIQLYRGDLLEDCYQDWCLFERERLQSMHLSMLEQLMVYYEAHGEYEAGLACGDRVLRYEAAHERTHRRLMRLHYLLGNRTAALRQYERCVAALRDAFNVSPSERTAAIYEQIRSDRLTGQEGTESRKEMAPSLLQTLSHLERLQTTLAETQRQLQQVVGAVEMSLRGSS